MTTTNLGLTLPTVGASSDVWGDNLNADLSIIDALFLIASGAASVSLKGTTTNDSAAAGAIGEFISATATSVAITTATPANITSISLTAGDWDVQANVGINPTAGSIAKVIGAIGTASATLPTRPGTGGYFEITTTAAGDVVIAATGTKRITIASTTTVYLVCQAVFSSTAIGMGFISARRVR